MLFFSHKKKQRPKMNKYETPVPNLVEATDTVMAMLQSFDEQNFYNRYTPQIVTTNEIEQIYELKKHINTCAKVLTVSGSGEQPLFSKLYGAEYVLTFDISYNAYLLTSLKIAAMQTFENHTEYEQFIKHLGHFCKPGKLTHTPKIYNVFQHMDTIQKNHIKNMDCLGMPIFLGDISCQNYTIQQSDYENLRESVKSPFPFVLTNIIDLDKKLGSDKFDIIYYSNILSFINPTRIKSVLENTNKHLNPGGKIFLVVENKKLDTTVNNIRNTYDAANWCPTLLYSPNPNSFNLIIIENKQR